MSSLGGEWGKARSPLRWLGGKKHLAQTIRAEWLRSGARRYIDPFAGGAGALLAVGAEVCLVADLNGELCNFFRAVRAQPAAVLNVLSQWADNRETYAEVRMLELEDSVEQAARFLYLNRTAFMGMYRVNSQGRFNVPYGGGGRLFVKDMGVRLAHLASALQRAEILHQDFRLTVRGSGPDDFVFLDPPYGAGSEGVFNRYSPDMFSSTDHSALVELAGDAVRRGSAVLLANGSLEGSSLPKHVRFSPLAPVGLERYRHGETLWRVQLAGD